MVFLIAVMFALYLFIINQKPVPKGYPYTFINSKVEESGNKMELFTYSDSLEILTLLAFCEKKKKSWFKPHYYFAVFFDDKDNAVFSEKPFTASYSLEDGKKKHIKAIYTYNRATGYSKLNHYARNAVDSDAIRISI